jgi:hypothetical protein
VKHNETKIYTLGTSTRTFGEFISLVRSFGIDLIIDVRRFPTSRFEWFKKETLESALKAARIQYLYMGKELGGYRSGGYEAYIQTEEFERALASLKEIVAGRTGAIVCAERLPCPPEPGFTARGNVIASASLVNLKNSAWMSSISLMKKEPGSPKGRQKVNH